MEKTQINEKNNNDNNYKDNESTENRLGLLEIEEMLKNNIKPPGIMEYDDMPPETPLEPSQSTKPKAKKPWESDDNQILNSNAEDIFGPSTENKDENGN